MKKKDCLWCGRRFDINRKRVALCPGCREAKKRQQTSVLDRQKAEERQYILERVLPQLQPELHSKARQLVDEYIEKRSDESALPEKLRMPPGYKSVAGPEEGCSTFFKDLEGELKTLSEVAAQHPWWRANRPEDVFFELGRLENAKEYFAGLAEERAREGAACRDAKGEQRGYQRHVRAGESACTACRRAQADYYRNRTPAAA